MHPRWFIVTCLFSTASAAQAFVEPRDPSPSFAAIEQSIDAQDYQKANDLLGQLMTSLMSSGVPPLIGTAHREVMDAGRDDPDLRKLVQQSREAWARAVSNQQPWTDAMVRLSKAFSSAVTLDAALPLALRYQQARARYAADPSIIRLHQVELRAFEAGEYAAARKFVDEERIQIPRAYRDHAGVILNRLETLAGVIALKQGYLAAALDALNRSALALSQHHERRLLRPPGMLLAQQLLQKGQAEAVLAYIEVCAQFEYPTGEEYTDEGPNPSFPAHLKAAIKAGKQPGFHPATLQID
ncbi:MAG: hypothetical protein H7039_10565 [Bryobacteraceae bacterium]|nr:hypothetical protein [Bryobacteraceae bacterium]